MAYGEERPPLLVQEPKVPGKRLDFQHAERAVQRQPFP